MIINRQFPKKELILIVYSFIHYKFAYFLRWLLLYIYSKFMYRMYGYITCELISRVLEKIERIHNMPRKAEHLSFQGKKILKIGAWVTELFYFLCSYSDFVRAETFFSHNSHVSEPISKILFFSESIA